MVLLGLIAFCVVWYLFGFLMAGIVFVGTFLFVAFMMGFNDIFNK